VRHHQSWSDGRLVRPAWVKSGRGATAPRDEGVRGSMFRNRFIRRLILWGWPRGGVGVRD